METIYVDRLLIINLIIDYLLALGTAKVCGLLLRRRRYFFSALFGAGYAVLSLLPSCGFLAAPVFKLASGIIMALIAFGGEEKFLRCVLTFFAVSALFGGIIWALSLNQGLGGSAIYIPLSMPLLLFTFGISYAVLSFAFSRTAKGMESKVYITHLSYNGNSAILRTLADSGNTLYDPVSGARVLVASREALAPLFPGTELMKNASELVLDFGGVFRLIPYSAVGTSGGMLAAFRPDSISLDGKEKDDVLVAVSPSPVCGEGFDSVIGP